MYLIPLAWGYVVLMMTVAEATSPNGTVLGAVITFVLYGVVPLTLILYLMGTPGRSRERRAREQAERAAATASSAPDAGGETPADPVPPVRKEP
jgi:hypothetical protein